MTNLPFLLQTTNFLSQSICTNIPSHQSPGARPNFHYLCKTDCKMKQKLTTANLGHCDSPGGREGRGRRDGSRWNEHLGKEPGARGRKKIFTRKSRGTEKKSGGGRKKGKSPKESLRNAQKSQRKKFRMSRGKGTIETWLRCKKSAQNCSVEKGEARRNIEITQIEWEWPQQRPEGFRDESTREIFLSPVEQSRRIEEGILGSIWRWEQAQGAALRRGVQVIQVHPRRPVHLQTLPDSLGTHRALDKPKTWGCLSSAQTCFRDEHSTAANLKLWTAHTHQPPALTEAVPPQGWRNSPQMWILRLFHAEELQRRAVGRGRSGHCLCSHAKKVFSLGK